MNIHKIILAVLAAATIAVGATTVAVHADGPSETPEARLIGEDSAIFHGLPQDVRAALANDVVPDLVRQGASDEFIRQFLAEIVRLERGVQAELAVAAAAASMAPASAFSGASAYTRAIRCGVAPNYVPTLRFSYIASGSVTLYTSVACTRAVDALTSSLEIARHGYSVERASNTLHRVSFASVVIHLPYYPGLYNYCGYFTAIMGFEANPQPSAKRKCVTNRRVR